MMTDGQGLNAEQIKLLNDYDLRHLIEQSVELRHAETVALAGCALGATLFGKLASDGTFNKLRIAFYLCGGLLLIVGAACERRARLSERRLIQIYNRMPERNGLDQRQIVFIGNLDPVRQRADRTPFPMVVFWIGVGCAVSGLLMSYVANFRIPRGI